MLITLIVILAILALFSVWRHGAKCYDKGITDAVLLHKNGRLKYNTFLDEKGSTMVNIEIAPED